MPPQNTASAKNRTNLLQRKQGWYARYFVPKHLQATFGRAEVQRTLRTRDKLEAQRRLPTVLAQLQREVAEETRGRLPVDHSSPTHLIRELESLEDAVRRGDFREPEDPAEVHPAELQFELAMEEHYSRLGDRDPETGIPAHVSPAVHEAAGRVLRAINDPTYKPISEWAKAHIANMEAKGRKPGTWLKRERFINQFMAWAGSRRDPRLITADDVVAYGDRLNSSTDSTRKRKDAATEMHGFFEWLRTNRRIISTNPFHGLRSQIEVNPDDDELNKRAWYAEELEIIFKGFNPLCRLWTIAAIGLYSGMRINEICSLEVSHIGKRGMTVVRANAKNDNSARDVPIHPLIASLIETLVATSYDGYLISGLKPGGQDKRRGAYPSKRFSEQRSRLGLTDPETTFHSFRHSFATAAERALIPKSTIELLTGHARQGITLSRYSDGPEWRTKVEAVARITHDQTAFDDQPAVAVDSLVSSLLVGHQGNAGWKGQKMQDLLPSAVKK